MEEEHYGQDHNEREESSGSKRGAEQLISSTLIDTLVERVVEKVQEQLAWHRPQLIQPRLPRPIMSMPRMLTLFNWVKRHLTSATTVAWSRPSISFSGFFHLFFYLTPNSSFFCLQFPHFLLSLFCVSSSVQHLFAKRSPTILALSLTPSACFSRLCMMSQFSLSRVRLELDILDSHAAHSTTNETWTRLKREQDID